MRQMPKYINKSGVLLLQQKNGYSAKSGISFSDAASISMRHWKKRFPDDKVFPKEKFFQDHWILSCDFDPQAWEPWPFAIWIPYELFLEELGYVPLWISLFSINKYSYEVKGSLDMFSGISFARENLSQVSPTKTKRLWGLLPDKLIGNRLQIKEKNQLYSFVTGDKVWGYLVKVKKN